MRSSRKTTENYFRSPVQSFAPSGARAGLSRLKTVAVVAGVFAGMPVMVDAAMAGDSSRRSPDQVARLQLPSQLGSGSLGARVGGNATSVDASADRQYRAPPTAGRLLSEHGAGMGPPARSVAALPSLGGERAELLPDGDYAFRVDQRPGSIRVGRDVVENVFAASRIVGADPAMVMALSWRSAEAVDHGSRPATGARVAGLFAYDEQRFLQELVRWGPSLGIDDVVAGIRMTSQGAYVAVGYARDAIEGLRRDIHANALIGAANAKSAQAILARHGHGGGNTADVLVAMQFGSEVALDLVKARMTNPHHPMSGPLADVVAGMGLSPRGPGGQPWTVSSFNEATELRLQSDMRLFASMRRMTLAEQHRPLVADEHAHRPGPR